MIIQAYICNMCGNRVENKIVIPVGWYERRRQLYDDEGNMMYSGVKHLCGHCGERYIEAIEAHGEEIHSGYREVE